MRRALGLPEVAGLLVCAVEAGSRAQRAEIAVGDVLVDADGCELRSITALYAAVREAADGGQMNVSAIRGVDTKFDAVLDLRPGGGGEAASPEGGGDPAIHTL